MATLFAEEILLALRYINGLEPCKDPETGYVYNGFITDTIQRNLGVQLVDGTMPGFAAIIGAAPTDDIAVSIVRGLQERNILTFLSGQSNGDSVTRQLLRKGVELVGMPELFRSVLILSIRCMHLIGRSAHR